MDHRRSCPAGHKQIGGLEEYAEIEHFFIAQETDDLPDLVTRENIDIVLMDIHLGKSSKNDGLMIARSLLKSIPHLKIIMLTGYDLPVYRHEAKKAGVSGFLNKNINPDKLFISVRKPFPIISSTFMKSWGELLLLKQLQRRFKWDILLLCLKIYKEGAVSLLIGWDSTFYHYPILFPSVRSADPAPAVKAH